MDDVFKDALDLIGLHFSMPVRQFTGLLLFGHSAFDATD